MCAVRVAKRCWQATYSAAAVLASRLAMSLVSAAEALVHAAQPPALLLEVLPLLAFHRSIYNAWHALRSPFGNACMDAVALSLVCWRGEAAGQSAGVPCRVDLAAGSEPDAATRLKRA